MAVVPIGEVFEEWVGGVLYGYQVGSVRVVRVLMTVGRQA